MRRSYILYIDYLDKILVEDFKKKNAKKMFYILFVSTTVLMHIDLFINMHQNNRKNNIANEHTWWNRNLKFPTQDSSEDQ